MKVRIKRIDKSLPLPVYATTGACGFDLYSRTSVTIKPTEIKLLPSNYIIEVPEGYVLILVARSSLAKNKGLILPNAVGIIDQDYAGEADEILIQAQNITQKSVKIEKGERLVQGLFLPVLKVDWLEVSKVSSESRGGIGSTAGYYMERN